MVKKIVKYFFLILFLSLFVWTLYFLWSKSKTPPTVYETVTPFDTTVIKKTVATGSVIPRKEVNIKSQVSGIIEKLYVIAGQQIKAGDVIAKVKIIPNMANLANAENRINLAKLNYESAKVDFDRQDKLYKQNVISKAEWQPYDLKVKSTEEELKAAEDNLTLVKDGVTKSAGSATNTLVKATITGMVLDVPVKEGTQVIESNTFNEGTTIATVANMGEMIFEGKLDESEVGKVVPGMDILLTIGAIDAEKFGAKLEYIAPKGATENGAIQFLIRAAINKESSTFLRAGYSANADIILDKKEKVMCLPESVLQFDKDKVYVEVETGPQQYEKRYVKTGISDGINIQIVEGVKKGDKIKNPNATPPEEKKG